jgi:hypothetical protein
MQATMNDRTFRGVACRHCGQPSRVRPAIAQREWALNKSNVHSIEEWRSRVFSHRCRTCGGEAIHALDYIVDFEDENSARDL